MLSLAAHLDLEKGKVIRIMGPASIAVSKGKIRILGMNFTSGTKVVIHRYRSYAVKALEDSTINVVLGEGGGIEEPAAGEEVIDIWEEASKSIIDSKGVAVVLGPVDSGKTSFSLLVANMAIEQGLRPAIVDADVGQGDLAPPGFIAMKILTTPLLWLREAKGDVMRLVGSITPTHAFAMSRLVVAIRDLVDIAMQKRATPIVVNTDGWTTGYLAIDTKLSIIKTVHADHVAVLDDVLCERIKRALGSLVNVLCLPRPRIVRERDRIDRRLLRKQHYQSFFQKAKRICLRLSEITLLNSCVASGTLWSSEAVEKISKESGLKVYAIVEHDDVIIALLERVDSTTIQRLRELLPQKEVYVVTRDSVKGLLAAILNEKLEEIAPALIDSLELDRNEICILTEYEGTAKGLSISRIRLSSEWEEVGRVIKCPL